MPDLVPGGSRGVPTDVSSPWINPQHLNKFRHLAQMAQAVTGILVISAQQIHKKHVLPWTPAYRTRLNFAQADIAQRKYAQRLEQSTRNILDAERQRSLVRLARCAWLSPMNQEEAGKVLLVILNPCFQNLPSINLNCPPAGNARRVAQAFRHHMLHASRRIVKRHRIEARISGKQVAALIERHGMREYAPDFAELRARQSNQVVNNAQSKFAHNMK